MSEDNKKLDDDEIKKQLINAILPHVPFDGWGRAALSLAAKDMGMDYTKADILFPSGAGDVIAYHAKMMDDLMVDKLQNIDLASMKIHKRITIAVKIRLQLLEPNQQAVSKGLSFMALPSNGALALKILYKSVDNMWYMAGDTATDWNFYSKRILLAAVYSSTMLYWLNDTSKDYTDSWQFLDRRISEVMKIPKIKAKINNCFNFIPQKINVMRVFKSGHR